MKSNFIKLAIAGLSLAILSGCANTRALEVNDVSNDVGYIAPNESELANNIQVETQDFVGTDKFMLKNQTMPTFNNSEAKKAIIKVLKEANLHNVSGEYKLTASLEKDHVGVFTTSRELIINYKLVNINTNQLVFEEIIKTDGSSKSCGMFCNAYEVAYDSGLDAFDKNFYEMTILVGNHDK